jgi:hypothetical protein
MNKFSVSFARLARLVIAFAFAAGAVIPAHAQTTWTNYTTGSGLGNNLVRGVYATGSTIYAATQGGGLSVSPNNGTTWTNYTTGSGLGSNTVYGVYAAGSTIYAATSGGLSVGVVAVPEPSTYAMALAGLACGGYSLFRRRRAR